MKTASIIVALASAATNKSVVTAIDVSSPVVVAAAIGEDASSSSSASSTLGSSGSSGGTIRAASSSIVTKTNNSNNAATATAAEHKLPPSFQQRVTNIGIASYESSKRAERSRRHTEANDMIRHGVLSSQRGDSGDSGSSAMLKKSNNKKKKKEDDHGSKVANDRNLLVPSKKEHEEKISSLPGATALETMRMKTTNNNNEETTTTKKKKKEEEERELKKTKSGKDDWYGGGSWDDKPSSSSWGGSYDDDDDKYGGWDDNSSSSHDNLGWGKPPSWGGGSSKSGKGWGNDSWGGGWKSSGKSGKIGEGGGGGGGSSWGTLGKSGKGWGGGGGGGSGWGSGKAGKGWGGGGSGSRHGGGWGGGGGGWCGDQAWVTVTNLSFQQSFSEIFAMTATWDVTDHEPIYEFGEYANEALQELAENANADEMENRYEKRHGVEQVKVFSDFDFGKYDKKFLEGGSKATFKVRTSGYGHYLSIAVGLPFTNDGAVVLEGVPIYDGAEYYVPPIDAGTEANIQTCWSVAAKQDDFPPRSVCYKEANANDNFNDIGGEGFVSMHRGIQDLDSNNELQDLLQFIECNELDIINDDYQFAQYFWEVGFDDYILFCDNPVDAFFDWDRCDLYDDTDFLNNLDDLPDFYDKSLLIIIARESADFDDFCDRIQDANKDLEDGFKTLEPFFFDWRNEIMKVEIDCGWHDDGWKDDAWKDDDWGGWSGDSHSSSEDSSFDRNDWY